MNQARYICKRCGAESPVGIGYVIWSGEKPVRAEPAPDCPNPHLADNNESDNAERNDNA